MSSLDKLNSEDFWDKLEADTKLDDEQKLRLALIKLILDNNQKFLNITAVSPIASDYQDIVLLGGFNNE